MLPDVVEGEEDAVVPVVPPVERDPAAMPELLPDVDGVELAVVLEPLPDVDGVELAVVLEPLPEVDAEPVRAVPVVLLLTVSRLDCDVLPTVVPEVEAARLLPNNPSPVEQPAIAMIAMTPTPPRI